MTAVASALPAAVASALQQALAAEHAAVFGYAALGPHLAAAQMRSARQDEAAHRSERDALVSRLTAAGIEATASAADYPVPAAMTAQAAQQYALSLETVCCRQWRYVVAVAVAHRPQVTTDAVRALTASAVRATGWRARLTPAAPTTPFPGI